MGDSTRQVPALVVSGYLGSGKTTLVRHLLDDAQRRGLRLAVVSNEFGALGIDAALLGASTEVYVELEGGCVCCQLGDELLDTLVELREKVDPDRIVVETSGVALPYDTLLNFWREPIAQWITDESAAVVVDAERVRDRRDLDGTFEDQVSSADLLVVNKTDLIAADEVAAVHALLREIEPDAPIVDARFGRIDVDLLYPPDTVRAARDRQDRRDPHDHDHPHDHENFVSREVRAPEGYDDEALAEWVRALDEMRVKGFARTASGVRVVQGVGRRVNVEAPREEPPAELIGRLVVIGREKEAPTDSSSEDDASQ